MGIFQFAYIQPWSEMRVCEKRKSAKGTHTMFLAIWGPSWTRSFTFNVSASQSFPSFIIWEIHCFCEQTTLAILGGKASTHHGLKHCGPQPYGIVCIIFLGLADSNIFGSG